MNQHTVTLRHDTGTVRLTVNASTREQAEEIACNAERAPRSAIVRTDEELDRQREASLARMRALFHQRRQRGAFITNSQPTEAE